MIESRPHYRLLSHDGINCRNDCGYHSFQFIVRRRQIIWISSSNFYRSGIEAEQKKKKKNRHLNSIARIPSPFHQQFVMWHNNWNAAQKKSSRFPLPPPPPLTVTWKVFLLLFSTIFPFYYLSLDDLWDYELYINGTARVTSVYAAVRHTYTLTTNSARIAAFEWKMQ